MNTLCNLIIQLPQKSVLLRLQGSIFPFITHESSRIVPVSSLNGVPLKQHKKRTLCSQAHDNVNQLEEITKETSDHAEETEITKTPPVKTRNNQGENLEKMKRIAHAKSDISIRLQKLSFESKWTPECETEDMGSESRSGFSRQKKKFSQMEDYVPNKTNNVESNEDSNYQRMYRAQFSESNRGRASCRGRASWQQSTNDHRESDWIDKKFNKHGHMPIDIENKSQYDDGEHNNNIVVHGLERSESDSGSDVLSTIPEMNISHIRPVKPSKSFSLAVYVNDSETLQNLVKLGVDLSKVENYPDVAELITRSSWEQDIVPHIVFLKESKVKMNDIGKVISGNPAILQESVEDLQIRVNYFESKKFSRETIARFFTEAPKITSLGVDQIDKRLGAIQKQFILTGNEVRYIIQRYPKLLLKKETYYEAMSLTLSEELGFTDEDQKDMLMAWPKLFVEPVDQVSEVFEYIHNEIGLSHRDIVNWPNVFSMRLTRIKPRHEFLDLIDRAQYDQQKENYVSMKALITGTDADFCANVAKVPIEQYNDYLKGL